MLLKCLHCDLGDKAKLCEYCKNTYKTTYWQIQKYQCNINERKWRSKEFGWPFNIMGLNCIDLMICHFFFNSKCYSVARSTVGWIESLMEESRYMASLTTMSNCSYKVSTIGCRRFSVGDFVLFKMNIRILYRFLKSFLVMILLCIRLSF